MRIGFIGLGNVGGQLAGNLPAAWGGPDGARPGCATRRRLRVARRQGRKTPRELAEEVDLVITCLPSPAISAEVMESRDGVLAGLTAGKIWLEMSTTDQGEIQRLGDKALALGAFAMDCPVSGGCHRAATGNISIFAGGERATFERVLPVLAILGPADTAYRSDRLRIRAQGC